MGLALWLDTTVLFFLELGSTASQNAFTICMCSDIPLAYPNGFLSHLVRVGRVHVDVENV